MLLQPKYRKFRKFRKRRIRSNSSYYQANRRNFNENLKYGQYGLRAIERARMNSRQLEATRRALRRSLQRRGKLWLRVFPDIPVTAKPLEVRMGKGKGNVRYWIARISAGQIIYEIDGVPSFIAIRALKRASKKIPFGTSISYRWNPRI